MLVGAVLGADALERALDRGRVAVLDQAFDRGAVLRGRAQVEGLAAQAVAIGLNLVALLLAGSQLVVFWQRIENYAGRSKDEVFIMGFGLPLIPVLIISATLIALIEIENR